MYGAINLDFLWFISASMGLIYSGVLNIIFCRSEDRSKGSIILVQGCNLLNILFSGLAIYLIREIQALIILIFSVTLFVMWLFRDKGNLET
jgi:hypothetical protein